MTQPIQGDYYESNEHSPNPPPILIGLSTTTRVGK